jgi:flagellar biosynthesis/type III secretory pathway chaperone
MTAKELLGRLDRLLAEEREAIQSLDGETIAKITNEKEEVLESLKGATQELVEHDLAGQLQDTLAGLRRNGVLLVHARACLRELVAALRMENDGRLSIRG